MINQPNKHHRHQRKEVPDWIHPIILAAFAEAEKRKITIRDMARLSGVDEKQMYKWRDGTQPKLMNIDAVLTVVGLKLTVSQIEE